MARDQGDSGTSMDRAELIARFRAVFGLLDWQSAQIKEQMLAPFHLTTPQVTVLTILGTGEEFEMAAIAMKSGLPPGTVTSVLDRLLLRQLAKRGERPAGGRRITWSLTSQGRDMVTQLENRRTTVFQELVDVYSDTELDQLLQLFQRWVELGERVIATGKVGRDEARVSSTARRGTANVLRSLPNRRQ